MLSIYSAHDERHSHRLRLSGVPSCRTRVPRPSDSLPPSGSPAQAGNRTFPMDETPALCLYCRSTAPGKPLTAFFEYQSNNSHFFRYRFLEQVLICCCYSNSFIRKGASGKMASIALQHDHEGWPARQTKTYPRRYHQKIKKKKKQQTELIVFSKQSSTMSRAVRTMYVRPRTAAGL